MSTTEDVLIVGAGPAGLFTAAELARHGVPARVVERDSAPHRQARATAIQPGTLEVLARAGVLEPFLDAGEHVGRSRIYGPDLTVLGGLSFDGVDCVCEFQCCLPQWRTEELLLDHLTTLGGVVERGVAASAIEHRDGGVLVRLERAAGSTETVEARYLVGAGGAHSVTRDSMHETLEGDTYPGVSLVADIRLLCPFPRGESALVAGPGGYVFLSPLPDDRWITFIGPLDEEETTSLAPSPRLEEVAQLIEPRLGGGAELEDVGWASLFRMHRRIAPRLASDRRFLVGDAGHLSSPFGGEGLNSGLHDGADLAWKLALALQGRGRAVLLESYGIERAMADAHVLAVSDLLHSGVIGIVDAIRAGTLPAVPTEPAAAAMIMTARSMIDTSYAGSPIVGEHLGHGFDRPSSGPAPGERYPDRTVLGGTSHHLLLVPDSAGATPDPATVERLRCRRQGLVEIIADASVDPARAGVPEGGAALVRPDGYLGFRAIPADDAGLATVDAHIDSYLLLHRDVSARRAEGDPC